MGCIQSALAALKAVDENKTYLLVSKLGANKVIGCAGTQTADGTKCILWERIIGCPDQEWKFKKAKLPGTYIVSPVHAPDKALHIAAAKEQAYLYTKAKDGDDLNENQVFVLIPVPQEDGFFFIQQTETKCALDVRDFKTENGTHILGWDDFHRGENQKWRLQEVVDPIDTTKTFNIVNKWAPNKVVGCAARSTDNGTKVILWDSDADANQKWKVVKHASNKWSFVPQHATTKQLDTPGLGEQCHLWDSGDGKNENQLWALELAEEAGYFFLKSQGDRVLDVATSEDPQGAHVVTRRDFNKGPSQQWKFVAV